MQIHLKNELNMDDATARTTAKQALSEFRNSGSEAIMRTSDFCNNETAIAAITCDSSSQFRTIEGRCNNLDTPIKGAFHAKFLREVEVDPYDAKDGITIKDPVLSKNNGIRQTYHVKK